jgi:hypothetical protein
LIDFHSKRERATRGILVFDPERVSFVLVFAVPRLGVFPFFDFSAVPNKIEIVLLENMIYFIGRGVRGEFDVSRLAALEVISDGSAS